MAVIDEAKGLHLVGPGAGAPFAYLESPGMSSTYSLDLVCVEDCWFVGIGGEGGAPPAASGALGRVYPPFPAQRVFPPIPAQRVFPL